MKTIKWKADIVDDGHPVPDIKNGEDVVRLLRDRGVADRDRECFNVIALGARKQFLGLDEVSVGSLTATIAEVRETFASAISLRAASIIVAHNHPSGDVTPSSADGMTTVMLRAAGEVLGIELVDHLIVGAGTGEYYSFREGAIVAEKEVK